MAATQSSYQTMTHKQNIDGLRLKDQSDYILWSCSCVYLIICGQRGVVFVVVVGGDGLDLKFNAEVVAVGV